MSTASAISAAEPATIPAPNSRTNITALMASTISSTRRWSRRRASISSSVDLAEQHVSLIASGHVGQRLARPRPKQLSDLCLAPLEPIFEPFDRVIAVQHVAVAQQ